MKGNVVAQSGKSSLAASPYITGSLSPTSKMSALAADSQPSTYVEQSFNRRRNYRPPVGGPIRRPFQYAGGGIVPGRVNIPEDQVATDLMLINPTDFLLINSTDKFII